MQSVVRLQRQQALVRSVIAKEKKTRGHGGCFLSYEIGIQLQESKGKESEFPPFQTLSPASFPPFSPSYDFPSHFLLSKLGVR